MLMVGTVAVAAGMSINFVVVTPLTRKAGLSEMEVAGFMTLSTIIFAVMIPVWGRIADLVGRKRVMIFSLFATALTNMAFLFTLEAGLAGILTGASLLLTLTFVRAWFGLLAPGLQPAAMAAMTDATVPTNRAAGLGMIGAAMAIGSIIGPAGAAVLAPFGALAPLWGTIVFCVLVGFLIAFTLPRTVKRARNAPRPRPLSLTDTRMRPHLLFLLIYFIAIGMMQQTLAWFIEDRYRLTETLGEDAGKAAVLYTGITFACYAVASLIVQFGYINRVKPDPRKVLPIGLAMVAGGYLAADLFYELYVVYACFFVVGAGAALAIPSANALGSLSVSREEQGAAAALLAVAPPSGFIFGPMIGAWLYGVNHALPLLGAATMVGALAVYAVLVTARRPLTPG
ncbi:major facilitator family transporter [Hyphomonas neptunium ATCC 15444]|uniref:Major facilitator family transporter n=2 Tax=Hyphomonas TaxID=85 RepID=Q0BX64_HYPNA|nr:major facilitator family transporter [Hyphomonas neptunium ATCC 15444]